MMKFFKKIKLEIFYLRKSFFEYKNGFKYIFNKYILAKRILKFSGTLEKPINHSDFSMHILTCHKDIIMSIWALMSYYRVANILGQLYIHNDGSLNSVDKNLLLKLFPHAIIINSQDFVKEYGKKVESFPTLLKFRTEYKNFSFKKIIDPYFVSDKSIQLIIDSDVLWYKNPVDIENEIKNNCQNSLMQSDHRIINSTFKDGSLLSTDLSCFNSGIVLFAKENFDLNKFSNFLNNLDVSRPQNLHFADQSGYAYSLNNLLSLSQEKYPIKNNLSDLVVAKHYTSPRRPLFFIEGVEIINQQTNV